jgi:flagellar basal-body rod protein FlgG
MNSGMYAALTGSINSMKRLDIISNNIANANTPGFKKDRLAFETQLKQAGESSAKASAGPDVAPVFSGDRFYTDYSAGPVQQTGNVLDLALEGDGFFEVTTPNGPAYTRQGNFRMDVSGALVTAEGYPLSPSITVPNNATQLTVGSDGTVSAYMPGETSPVTVGTLQVVDFPKPYNLQKVAGAMFQPTDPQISPEPASKVAISQGAIEGANVSTISEMVMLIENSRYFEACSKVVKSFDDMTAKAANDLGRV